MWGGGRDSPYMIGQMLGRNHPSIHLIAAETGGILPHLRRRSRLARGKLRTRRCWPIESIDCGICRGDEWHAPVINRAARRFSAVKNFVAIVYPSMSKLSIATALHSTAEPGPSSDFMACEPEAT
jgi:hypothetical protein